MKISKSLVNLPVILALLLGMLTVHPSQAAPNGDTWRVVASMPTARTLLGAVTGSNGLIYAIGGTNYGVLSQAVEAYDPLTNTWTIKASLSIGRHSLGVAAAPNGMIYAMGGRTSNDFATALDIVEEYDPNTDTWTTRASMPTKRAAFGLAVGSNGRIYAIGGYNGSGAVTSADEYDPVANTWTTKASMSVGRFSLGVAAAANGMIYAIGGVGGETTVEQYNPVTNTWTKMKDMSIGRWNIGAAAAGNGKVYIIGGQGLGPSMAEYDPVADTWTMRANMLLGDRICAGAAVSSDGKVYAIGGHNNSSMLATVEEYTPPSGPITTFTITGKITTNGTAGLSGVSVSDGAGHNAITDGNGGYTLSGLITTTYTLTPTLAGYNFTPPSRTISVPPGATNQDFIATAAAAVPSLLATASAGYANILAAWDWSEAVPNIANLAGYELYRSDNGGTFVQLTTAPVLTSQYLDTSGLVHGVQYCYQVKAVNAAGGVLSVSNVPCATFGQLVLWAPDMVAAPAAHGVIVPVNLSNGDGLCIGAFQLTLHYNQSVIVATGVISRTIYTDGYSFVADTTTPGEVSIAAIGSTCQPLHGAGTLFNVGFDVTGATGQTTPIAFVTGLTATVLYDESDFVNPVPLALTSGSIIVSQAFTHGDVNGDTVVNVADAALALQIASGALAPTPPEQTACDVNGDAQCNAADASLLLCYVAYKNWDACGMPIANIATRPATSAASTMVTISLGAVAGSVGQTILVPVTLSGGSDFAGGTFSFSYDPAQMTFAGVSLGSLTNAFSIKSHVQQPGLVRVALAHDTALGGDGTFLILQFTLTGAPTQLGLAQFRLNDGSGRDFETSALQKKINVTGAGGPHRLFLPSLVK